MREWERYLELSPFLPRVNAELDEGCLSSSSSSSSISTRNKTSSSSSSSCSNSGSLASLRRLVLFRFLQDSVVVPRDSAWFSELRRGRVVPLRETPLYRGREGDEDDDYSENDDPLGLRELDEGGRLLMRTAPGNHMRFSVDWFVREVVRPFLLSSGEEEDEKEEVEGGGGGGGATLVSSA